MKESRAKNQSKHYPLIREGLLLLMGAVALFFLLGLVTFHAADPGWSHWINAKPLNAGGRAGAWLADLLICGLGFSAYLVPPLMIYVFWNWYWKKTEALSLRVLRAVGFLFIFLSGSALINLLIPINYSLNDYPTGGILGDIISSLLLSIFNFLGASVLLAAIFLMAITWVSGISWIALVEKLGALILQLFSSSWSATKDSSYRPSNRSTAIKRPKRQPIVEPDVDEEELIEEEEEASFVAVSAPVMPKSKPVVVKPKAITVAKVSSQSSASPILPDLSLLTPPVTDKNIEFNEQELEAKSIEVEQRLADFGVQVKVVAVHPGPVVTRYELELAAGTKVSKISNLSKDLARSLSVTSVRVVEVIPGKSVIGIELPNKTREIVGLQEVLASQAYQNARAALTLALGKDIAGHPVIVDLAKMPHLLVAGTTGSGKSVGLNAILLSLLYKSTAQELRLILIDPKMLELAVYEGIPHLLTPVVTDMRDAATALRWGVGEMERRYRLMATLGVRNITGYNQKVREARERGEPLLDPLTAAAAEEDRKELTELPQIVILADEFADMMVVVGKKVETLIARLAQKARASGIHLILATQRPSVDVITGLIKANIPTRIAFQVSSKIDSRTILDQQGAEQLLGYGDMLYLPPGTGVPVRVHGAYVSDDDVHHVVGFLKTLGKPEYIEEILEEDGAGESGGFGDSHENDDGEQDSLYDEAVEFITKARRVSISSIQRRFKIGYNRAARIVESMEAAGVVSKMEQNGNREVLVPERSHD